MGTKRYVEICNGIKVIVAEERERRIDRKRRERLERLKNRRLRRKYLKAVHKPVPGEAGGKFGGNKGKGTEKK